MSRGAVWVYVSALVLLLAGPASSSTLDDYIARPDPAYTWTVFNRGEVAQTRYAELRLTSQVWRGQPWQHQLFVMRPTFLDAGARHALLLIDGGSNGAQFEPGAVPDELPPYAELLAALANALRTPVAVLKQVPNQPLYGLSEDALIAFTFEQYVNTADADWPLLLPMTKAAVRGMDAVQAFADQEWGLAVDTFTVTGASKRGWTTWLSGATDPRVTAIAPIVIDVLHMDEQVAHQQRVWGETSVQIQDYAGRGLFERFDEPIGQQLLSIVDPYRYRDRLLMPKLIVVGTNDAFWPVDSRNLYGPGLLGETSLVYVPNAGHGLGGLEKIIGTLHSFHAEASGRFEMPEMVWDFRREENRIELTIWLDKRPVTAKVWLARSEDRDFRDAEWQEQGEDGFTLPGRKRYEFESDLPESGYMAMFAEVTYFRSTVLPFFISTPVQVVDPNGKLEPRVETTKVYD